MYIVTLGFIVFCVLIMWSPSSLCSNVKRQSKVSFDGFIEMIVNLLLIGTGNGLVGFWNIYRGYHHEGHGAPLYTQTVSSELQ